MIRSDNFANERTRIAFIVCSRILHQQGDKVRGQRWLDIFMQSHTLDIVMNFSDFVGENVLFGGRSSTKLPATVIIYRAMSPRPDSNVTYIAPKWYAAVRHQNEITISQSDVHSISQASLSAEPFLWKTAFRGTPRDFKLLHKLQNLPSLEDVLSKAGIHGSHQRSYGLTFGNKSQKDAGMLKNTPFLPSKMNYRYGIKVADLPLFNRPTVAAKSNRPKLELPILVLFRSLHNCRARTAVVDPNEDRSYIVFDHMYYGISLAHAPWLAYRVNALLNSKLVFYLLFMFSSALGWDRRLVEPVDWFNMRLPSTILDKESMAIWKDLLLQEQWLREFWVPNAKDELKTQIIQIEDALDQAVYRLYGLSDQEITLIEDTIRYTIRPFLERTQRAGVPHLEPSKDDLERYARRLCSQLNSLLQYADIELGATTLTFGNRPLLAACQFSVHPLGKGNRVEHIQLDNISKMLDQLSEDLRSELADHLYTQRDLHVYQDSTFWIIKQAEIRQWSEAAAINDADAVLREHMETMTRG